MFISENVRGKKRDLDLLWRRRRRRRNCPCRAAYLAFPDNRGGAAGGAFELKEWEFGIDQK